MTPSPSLSWESTPSRELVRLAGPMVVSLLSMTVLNLVDTLFVGRLGPVALAAAGLGGVVAFTVVSFGMALFGAAKVKVGEAFGRADRASLLRAGATFFWLSVPLGCASLVVGQLLALGLGSWTTDAVTGDLAARILRVRSAAFPFVLVTSALSSWLGAQGETRAPMRAAVLGNVLNVPLNAWFIFGLEGGAVGGAWATVVAQTFECAFLVLTVRRELRSFARVTLRELNDVFVVGFATGAERVLDMLAFAAVPLLLARLDPVEVASHQIVLQLSHISFMPLIALSEGTSILVSQAVGADRTRLVRRVGLVALGLTLAYSAICGVFFVGARTFLVGAFSSDPHVLEVARSTIVAAALLQFINSVYNVIKGILRGLSVFRYVAVVTVGVAWTITPPLTWLVGVKYGYGAVGAWCVLCLEVAVGTLLLLHRLQRAPEFAPLREAPARVVS